MTGDPPPAPYVEDDRAATVGDLRSLRRWLLVTAVWAVAATALGVIALIQANMVPRTKPRAPGSTVFIHVAAPVIPQAWEQYLSSAA